MAFLIVGDVHKVFVSPGGKDRKTGQEYPESHRVQLLCPVVMKNGEVRDELYTLTLPGGAKQARELQEAVGTTVTLPVGLFASGGKITPFLTEEAA